MMLELRTYGEVQNIKGKPVLYLTDMTLLNVWPFGQLKVTVGSVRDEPLGLMSLAVSIYRNTGLGITIRAHPVAHLYAPDLTTRCCGAI